MRIELKMTKWDSKLEIFLHDKDEFFYSKKRNINTKRISSNKLIESSKYQSSIYIKISKQKRIARRNTACVHDKQYKMFKCYENYFSKRRRCQFPWNLYNESEIPICNKYSELSPVLMNFGNVEIGAGRENLRASETPVKLKKLCPLPCTETNFNVKINEWNDWISFQPRKALMVMLDGFTMAYQEEYLECDSTCIIGNIGGNIGFFLGASILLGLDTIFDKIRLLISKFRIRKIKNIED